MALSQTDPLSAARGVLNEHFGFTDFRPGQAEVITRLLAGRNVAAVFPTGGGKSLCYQIPSQVLGGTTVVVSPLIALMKDQCAALERCGIAAARLDSSLTDQERRETMRGLRDGSIRLVYVAPERFFNERFLTAISSLEIALLAIDEAHCISQWGHHFRPDYLKLADAAHRFRVGRVLALTATATPTVLDDICNAFSIASEDSVRTPFHRPNLQLRSTLVDAADQYDVLRDRLRSRPAGATLVYVTRQRTTETLAERLSWDGIAALAYHAGLDVEQRHHVQQTFLDSDSSVVVATIAFGMGIDKPDIRYVYHYNLPKSLEAYAQEIGRAGRDGEPSVCELLLQPTDRIALDNFTYGDTPTRQGIGRFIELCHGQADEFFLSHHKLAYDTDIREPVVRTLLTYLELDGHLQSIGPRYETYLIQPRVTSAAILRNFSGGRYAFVASLLGQFTPARRGFVLKMAEAARALGESRWRLVKAIDFMAAQDWLEVRVRDLVHGYRWRRRSECPKVLADRYHARIQQREVSEVSRLDDVFSIARAERCQPQMLAEHFGEHLEAACGNCSFCRGEGGWAIPPIPRRDIGDAARHVLDEVTADYPDHLTTARHRAMFLCGLKSPRMARSRLCRHPSFGICAQIPFAQVLEQVERR